MQLRLFHSFRYSIDRKPDAERIVIVRTGVYFQNFAWQCQECGRRGCSYGGPRPDLLEWARKHHRCPPVVSPST